jgi:hypothetical protein
MNKNIFMRSSALNEDTNSKQDFKTLAHDWTADLHFFTFTWYAFKALINSKMTCVSIWVYKCSTVLTRIFRPPVRTKVWVKFINQFVSLHLTLARSTFCVSCFFKTTVSVIHDESQFSLSYSTCSCFRIFTACWIDHTAYSLRVLLPPSHCCQQSHIFSTCTNHLIFFTEEGRDNSYTIVACSHMSNKDNIPVWSYGY